MCKYNKKPDTIREYRAASHEFAVQLRKLADKYNELPDTKKFVSLHEEHILHLITAFSTFYDCAESLADELILTRHLYNIGCMNYRLATKVIGDAKQLETIRKQVVLNEKDFHRFQEALNGYLDGEDI